MITSKHLNKALSYKEYQKLSRELFELGRTTGDAPAVNTEFYLHYTKMNLSRTARIEKKTELTDEVKTILNTIVEPQQWIILVESWCGDVPHSLPVIQKMTEYQPLINLHILLRDKNLDVMDAYLTNGGRSIPKLIAFNNTLENELFAWGPRPKKLQKQIDEWKASGLAYPEIAELSQKWYNKNAGEEIQKELFVCLKQN